MFQDRDYQIEAVSCIWNYFSSGHTGNPLVAMPTGTGKSIVIGRFLQSVFHYYPFQRVIVLTHVKELIQQNYEKLTSMWEFAPAGVYSAGLGLKQSDKAITFAGIASVAKKWAMFGKVDLVLIDEAHLVSPNDETMYGTFLAGLRSINPALKVIGFTATPWRLGHGRLTDPKQMPDGTFKPPMFSDICFDITGIEAFNRLIAEGYLSRLVTKPTVTKLDIDGVHMRGGEFIEKELQTAVDREEVTRAAIAEAMELAHDRKKWLVFASGTEHADNVCDMLNDMGISAGCVHSKREGRDETIKAFKCGELRALVNNNVLTTGFDDPSIDCIIILRPTASSVLWVQMLGRGTRPYYVTTMPGHNGGPPLDLNTVEGRLEAMRNGGKRNCLVLDYAGNTLRLGPINDPVVPNPKGKGVGEAPVKECPKCGCTVHASLRWCDGERADGTPCDHEFTFENKLKQSASSGALIVGDLPVTEVFKVDHVTFSRHTKKDRPDSVKLGYYCGFKAFYEYVGFEHTDYAGRKAGQWWRQHGTGPQPATVTEALVAMEKVKLPTHLRVWTNKKYPEILGKCFDGTAFGTSEPSDYDEGPARDVVDSKGKSSRPVAGSPILHVVEDDEIPF